MKISKPQNFIEYINNECANKKILLLGCAGMEGDGVQFELLKENNKLVYGVDINRDFIDSQENVFYGDLDELNWFDSIPKNFNTVVMTEVLEHLKNPYNTLEYIYKNLPSNVEFYLSVPNGGSMGRFMLSIFNQRRLDNQDKYHYYLFSLMSLRNLVEKIGFEVTEAIPYNQRSLRYNPFTSLASGFILKMKK